MPELPEVETVRSDVHERVVGRRITETSATGVRTVRRSSAEAVENLTRGRTVISTGRHGKWLWLGLDDDACVLIHLRMSGQLRWAPGGKELRPPHTHVRFRFGRDELRFVDPRTFGEVLLMPSESAARELIAQGPDALTVTLPELADRLVHRRRAAKVVLLDQKAVAGIGNIYADEILHRARVRPMATDLTRPVVARIHGAITDVLGEAITARGSSLADEQYVDLAGQTGSFQLRHLVHARPHCGTCGAPVRRIPFQGRSAYFCPTCQRP